MDLDKKIRKGIATFIMLIGIFNHIVFLFFAIKVCYVSDFSCHGDAAGAEGMAYAFSLLIPQIVIEVVVLVSLIFFTILGITHRVNKYLNFTFIATLLAALLVNFIV